MTLAEWAEKWPYLVREHPSGAMHTPDTTIATTVRSLAWQLTDYRVSSVAGGTIWFTKREETIA